MSDSRTDHLICTRPFEWMEIAADSSGQTPHIFQCCNGTLTTSSGSTKSNSAHAIWNGGMAQRIRRSVIDGSFSFCKPDRCHYLNHQYGPVKYVTEEQLQAYSRIVDFKDPIPPPKMLITSFDPSCNLKCPSCRTEIRTASKQQRVTIDRIMEETLRDMLSDLSYIRLTDGGDPFSSRHLWTLIKSPTLTINPQLEIHIQTNGLLFTEKRWIRMMHLHDQITIVMVSIDAACESTYAVNRPPGDWTKLMENLSFISKIHKLHKFFFNLTFVVQQNNWREMERFVELGEDLEVDMVTFTHMDNWGHLTESEYHQRAVHRRTHPEHQQFQRMLRTSDILNKPFVSITRKMYTETNLIACG